MAFNSILVGIHRAIHDKVDPELEVYRKILKYNDVPYIELDSSDLDFWEKIQTITHFIYKWSHAHGDHQIANAIIPVIQYHYGKKCFPTWETSWHYDDKIKQTYLLQAYGFPICEGYVFYHKSKALQFVKTTELPLVFKLKNGAGSMNVQIVKTRKEAEKLVNKMFGDGLSQDKTSFLNVLKTLNFDFYKVFRFYGIKFRDNFIQKYRQKLWLRHKNYIYFQKFLPGNDFDTRVTTVGLRVHAFRRFNRKNDFRASGSNKWDIDPSHIDMRMVKIALDISKKFKFQSMAYDFLLDQNNAPKIVEMSYLYGGAGYPDFMNGYWDENLTWHSGRFWPQHFEMIDFLEIPDLKCPPDLDYDTNYKSVSI